jgi:DNA-directed RNA polymerase specialized sigma24 family protein
MLIDSVGMGTENKRRMAALARLAEVQAELDRLEAERVALVARCVRWGATWAEIAAVLGVSAQAAHRRFRHARYDPSTGKGWTEPPLPL